VTPERREAAKGSCPRAPGRTPFQTALRARNTREEGAKACPEMATGIGAVLFPGGLIRGEQMQRGRKEEILVTRGARPLARFPT